MNKNHFRIAIADIVFEITTIHPSLYTLCKDYLTNSSAHYSLNIGEKERNQEKKNCKSGIPYADAYYAKIALQHKITEILLSHDTILMHGATIAVNNSAYIFTAPSGTGKTTHILKWLERCPDSYVVNGDKPYIRVYDDGRLPIVYGSPWAGKEKMNTNTMVPLKAIVLLERAENNSIEPILFSEAFPVLYQQTYRPDVEEEIRKTLNLIRQLQPYITIWRFRCNNFKDDSFDVSYNTLVRGL